MNAALGSAGVLLGLVSCIAGVVTVAVGLRGDRLALIRTGKTYAFLAFGGAVLATAAMQRGLITRDFSMAYVADNGSSRTPALFNVATMWSALEGSILLWALVLAGYTALIAHRFRDRLDDKLAGWALLTMLTTGIFFFALMVGPANPFRSVSVPMGFDGPGPNPLLQNHPLVAFHPPMLYLGYVGFTVPFAFAIGALVTGRVGEGWLLVTRRWTLFAWGFLTAGIILGAWWSYEVLGWGGYWGWDPVENASLLPWLTGTAYIHSVMVQERRGMLRVWNLSLLCATFALTILGTFLTRSGVLDSVHAFSESGIGPWLLSFFAVIVIVTVGLIGWRGDRLRSPGRIDSPLSREGSFLANNVLFAALAFIVLLGTVFPLVVEAVTEDRLSVGAPYFDRMSMPIGLALLFLMAIAPVLPWRKASTELLRVRLFWPAVAATAAVVGSITFGNRGLAPVLAFGLGAFAGGAALRQIVLAARRQGWRGVVGRTNGGMVVHLGVVVFAVALAASQSYAAETELRLQEGSVATVGSHTLVYEGIEEIEDPEKTTIAALVRVDGGVVYRPAINRFRFGSQSIGTPSVKTSLTEDIYLTLLEIPSGPDDPAVIRVVLQPLVTWLWIGGGLMAIGTALAAFPGRRRRPTEPTSGSHDDGGRLRGGPDTTDDKITLPVPVRGR
ncbi:MAG: heme lyase CcmF/NrfE family subunit [Acidimicrobiales bacterium]|nr:heme lyase CcmF/NrfE family subunit [Acidimicrobiales bacterium]